MTHNKQDKTIAIVGAGLVGSFLAGSLAKQGFNVECFEKRPDSRNPNFQWEGRSINLALSFRGRKALRKMGVEQEVVSQCIPMKGRMMHDLEGNLSFMRYGVTKEQVILSCGRKMLNEALLNASEKFPNLKFRFNTTCDEINVRNTSVTIIENGQPVETKTYDAILGTDGAFSNVRSALLQVKGVSFSQDYLAHGYKELTIPPTNKNEFALYPNALHIWPRGEFMMIALPNPDKTFTATLFMPWDGENGFHNIKTEAHLLKFFKEVFPDAVPLMPDLLKEYFTNPTGYLATIKTAPWYSNNTLVLGDAAHAIVPFYGQGMNCSLQDGSCLDDLLQINTGNISDVFPEFYRLRKGPADAVAQLSLSNYIEMRSKVKSKGFLLRKSFEAALYKAVPNWFIPLYPMVSFTDIPYDEIILRTKRQDEIIDRLLIGLPSTIILAFVFGYPPARALVLGQLKSVRHFIKSAL